MKRILAPAQTLLRHRGLVVLLGCCLLLGLGYSFVGPFFSMFGTQEAAMSPMVFGLFMTATTLSGIGISTFLARISDTRTTRRSMLLLGSSAGILGYASFAFVRDPLWLTILGSLLLGTASITFSQLFAHAREVLMTSGIPSTDTPLYMNVFRLFMALAWTVGPAVASQVMIHFGFVGTFLGAATCFVLLALAVFLYIPAVPVPGAANVAQTSLRASLARADVLAHFVAFALIFTAGTMCMINVPLIVTAVLGGTVRHVGIIYCIAPVFELPLMFWLGLLATRGDQARLIRISVALAVVYYGLLGVVQAPWHIYPLQILAAAITAVTQGVAITFFQNFLPGQMGTATNLYSTAQRLGSMAGYLGFGVLVTATGHRTVFEVGAVLCVIALMLLWIHRPRTASRV
ncbi:MAG: sugar efflux transporter [Opitutaceae bacterium]|nr:sugar efflux transporter [Opitutaceae bacterium]